MDFFTRQDIARRTTMRLVLYFVMAIVFIFMAVNALLYLIALAGSYAQAGSSFLWHNWSAQALLGTLVLIVGGGALEWLRLREGGKAIAELMGARRIDFATRSALERQLLNVTEEMSIASGIPAPIAYILDDETAINAFVAGYSPQQSVLVVTKGALESLSRDELQGVIGHEFSHILNGDMRLNMRLLAVLAGILAIGQAGGFLMSSATDRRVHLQRKNRSEAFPALFVLGLGLWIIGYIGLVCGRLIKSAISREREKLADAASVQFTRSPDGLAGALYKISTNDSVLVSFHAEELSHMCFGESLALGRLFATHPPITERINAIAPTFLTRIKYRQPINQGTMNQTINRDDLSELMTGLSPSTSINAPKPITHVMTQTPVAIASSDEAIEFQTVKLPSLGRPDNQAVSLVSARVGEIRVEDLQSAQRLHQNLPVEISRALQTTTGAKAVLFALIANHQKTLASTIYTFFAEQHTFALWVEQLWYQLQSLDECFSLPIVDLALPRLSVLDSTTANEFVVELRRFVLLNQHVSVFEFSLLKIIEQHIQPSRTTFRSLPINKLAQPVAHLVATLLQYGAHPQTQRAVVYQQLLASVLLVVPPMPTDDRLTLKALDRALQQFKYLNSEGKKTVINLVATTIQSDGVLHLAEYELLRAIAALFACPLPLLQLERVVTNHE